MKKNIILGLFALMCVAVTISSCNKYPDGPKISLLTKKSRIANTWIVEKATSTPSGGSSTDITSFFSDYTITIEKDGTYKSTYGSATDNGTWTFGEDKDDVRFLSSASGSTEDSYKILRLKSKELWVSQTASNGSVTEIQYKQK